MRTPPEKSGGVSRVTRHLSAHNELYGTRHRNARGRHLTKTAGRRSRLPATAAAGGLSMIARTGNLFRIAMFSRLQGSSDVFRRETGACA